jgi:hypothetical protein
LKTRFPLAAGSSPEWKIHGLLILFLALTLVRGIIYVSVIPPWQAPDEEFHYIQSRRLTSILDGTPEDEWKDAFIASLFQFRYDELNSAILSREHALELVQARFERPGRESLSYWPYALATLLLSKASVTAQLYAMRLVSVLILVAVVAVGWATLRELFPQDHFILLVGTSFLVFLPQHTHIGSALSDGNLAELLVTAALYMLVVLNYRGMTRLRLVALFGLALLALLSKTTALPLILVMGIVLISLTFRPGLSDSKVKLGLLGAIVLIGVAGLWLSPYRSILLKGPAYLWHGLSNVQQAKHDKPGYVWTLRTTYQSFWALLGWLEVRLEAKWYGLLLVILSLAVVGLVRFSFRRNRGDTLPALRRAVSILELAFAAWILMLLLWFMAHPTGEIYAQGRYLYPAIVPIAILFALGWREITPLPWRRYVALAFFIFWFLLDTLTVWNYAIPFFYPLWRS